jgi:hypothetical protein
MSFIGSPICRNYKLYNKRKSNRNNLSLILHNLMSLNLRFWHSIWICMKSLKSKTLNLSKNKGKELEKLLFDFE